MKRQKSTHPRKGHLKRQPGDHVRGKGPYRKVTPSSNSFHDLENNYNSKRFFETEKIREKEKFLLI